MKKSNLLLAALVLANVMFADQAADRAIAQSDQETPESLVHGSPATQPNQLPGGLKTGKLLYQASMSHAESVQNWRMEGPGEVSFRDGWMQMRSPSEQMHHVFWCPERFPDRFIAQWEAQNLNTDAGLCIVFFAAAGLDGQSVLANDLPARDGTFGQYTRGAIRCYHVSYYANTPDAPDRGQANLRKNPVFHLVQEGEEGIPTRSEKTHLVTLAKLGSTIRLWIDERKVIDWSDTGKVGGEPFGAGSIGFRQMQWTHFRYRNFRVWEAGDTATNTRDDAEHPVGVEAIDKRKQLMLATAAARPVNLKLANPKLQNPLILARLAMGEADQDCIRYLARGARFQERASWFGMSSLAQILAAYENEIPEDVLQEIRQQVTRYPHFLGGGTENHRAMNRAAGVIFGERWPEETFHHGISGLELTAICKEYVKDYGRQIYASSMSEYLSPVYHATNTAPWLTLAEHAADEEIRVMADAIVAWMFTDLALNCHHNVIVPPLTRCKAQLWGQPGHDRLDLGSTLRSGWLYWGSRIESDRGQKSQQGSIHSSTVPHHAHSSYIPHPAICNLGAKRVSFPFSVRQSRPSGACFEALTGNAYGYQPRDDPEFGTPHLRNHLRSVYFDQDYALGAGYFRKNHVDPMYRELIPFGAVWKSNDRFARLVVGHPYWFVNYQPTSWALPSPTDMWSGVSPFQQVVHDENAAILLFQIPDIDPHHSTKLRWGPDFAKSEPLREPIRSCFAYYPDSIDQREQTSTVFFLREGDVYVAIRPLGIDAKWSQCAMDGYSRIEMPVSESSANFTGCVIELGSRREYGSFGEFQQRITSAKLDTTQLHSAKRVAYETTRGRRLEIQFNDAGWMPNASVNDQALDFDHWPICESPYVNCHDRVLEVHDGHQGFRIDWRGELPITTELGTGREDGTTNNQGIH